MKICAFLAAATLAMVLSGCELPEETDSAEPSNDLAVPPNDASAPTTDGSLPLVAEMPSNDATLPSVAQMPPEASTPGAPTGVATPGSSTGPTIDPPTYRANSVFVPHPTDIGDYNAFYAQDEYATPDVVRLDVVIENTSQGICTTADQSGCTLADVLADTNGFDDFVVDIPVHVSGDSLPDDGLTTNAGLRQRGNSARFGPQKSFRIRLDSKDILWRNEQRLQLNKNPFDSTRFKNKLAFDLFQSVPHFPSLRTQFVNLWIDNGQGPEDFGLFTHTEFVGKEYVRNRGLNENDNLYKAKFFDFGEGDLNNIQVDATGEPMDEAAFERSVEIKNGNDHRVLVKVVEALHDPDRSFDSIIEQHFNQNNVLTWLATNLILRQADAITHNFYIYNPAGTEMLYFLPWDYDGTFESEQTLTNSYTNAALAIRKFYGYARGINSKFVSRWYQQPGAHERLVSAINELRTYYYSDTQIRNHATILNNLVEPHLTQLPDSQNIIFEPRSPERMVNAINQNYIDITTNYAVPMEPTLLSNPEIDAAGNLLLQWEPAFDVTRSGAISYDLIVSVSTDFAPANWVFSDVGIPDVPNGIVSYPINTSALPSGRVYARLVARVSTDPDRFWQTNSNFHRLPDGTDMFGMLAIDLP